VCVCLSVWGRGGTGDTLPLSWHPLQCTCVCVCVCERVCVYVYVYAPVLSWYPLLGPSRRVEEKQHLLELRCVFSAGGLGTCGLGASGLKIPYLQAQCAAISSTLGRLHMESAVSSASSDSIDVSSTSSEVL